MASVQGAPYIPPTDDAGLASGLVLQEVHCALLRGAEGKGLSSDGGDAPRTAKLAAAEAHTAAWSGRVSKVILDAPPFAVDDDARVTLLMMPHEPAPYRSPLGPRHARAYCAVAPSRS